MSAASNAFDETVLAPAAAGVPPPWSPLRRVAWRFVFLYLILYCLPMPVVALPKTEWLGTAWGDGLHAMAAWVGKHVLHLSYEITVAPNGSGDTTSNYVQVLCFAVLAALGAAIWSALDRRRVEYALLDDRLRILVRYVLALTMLSYGLAKVLTTQFPPPGPGRLATPFGELSPMGVLWGFMGSSQPYCVFTGSAEVVGGLLLFSRRTTTLGALVVIGVMINVVALNLCYDVPVKLYSSHLLAMAVFLTLADARRLLGVLVLQRPTTPGPARPPFRMRGVERARPYLKTAFILLTAGWWTYEQYESWQKYGADAPRPALYGYYDVEELRRQGAVQAPRPGDAKQWRNVALDTNRRLRIWTMDGQSIRFRAEEDTAKQTVTLTRFLSEDKTTQVLRYSRPDPEHVRLEGTFNGDDIDVLLRVRDLSKSELLTRGFHWINEYPRNL